MDKQIHIIVEGKVQGVFFRDRTRQKARELELKGTVRNLPDGSVEIYAAGDDKELSELARWCETGSPYSKVDRVTVKDLKERQYLPPFEIVF